MMLSRLRPPHRFLGAAQANQRRKVHAAGGRGKGIFANDQGFGFRQFAFAPVGKARVQVFDNNQAQHGVAEELEALVAFQTAVGDQRFVRQGLTQRGHVPDGQAAPQAFVPQVCAVSTITCARQDFKAPRAVAIRATPFWMFAIEVAYESRILPSAPKPEPGMTATS